MPRAILAIIASVLLLVALAQSWMIVATLAAPGDPPAKIFRSSRERPIRTSIT